MIGVASAGLISAGIGAAGSIIGGNKAAEAAQEAARLQADAAKYGADVNYDLQKFKPYNVSSGVGNVTWGGPSTSGGYDAAGTNQQRDTGRVDEFGKPIMEDIPYSAQTTLSPEYQQSRDGLLASSARDLNQFDTVDPQEAAQRYMDYMKVIEGDTYDTQRSQIENRLQKQGLLGSTTGNGQMQAFNYARMRDQANRAYESEGQAQDMINNYQSRGLLSLNNATKLDQMSMDQLKIANGLGKSGTTVDASSMVDTAGTGAMAQSTWDAQKYTTIGNSVGDLFNSWNTPDKVTTNYNPSNAPTMTGWTG